MNRKITEDLKRIFREVLGDYDVFEELPSGEFVWTWKDRGTASLQWVDNKYEVRVFGEPVLSGNTDSWDPAVAEGRFRTLQGDLVRSVFGGIQVNRWIREGKITSVTLSWTPESTMGTLSLTNGESIIVSDGRYSLKGADGIEKKGSTHEY